MNNIEFANYNQTTIPCKYCPSAVKRSKLSFHESRCHKDELPKESVRRQEVEVQFPDTPSLIPEEPICHIVPNDDTKNWEDSNFPTYNYNAPLATAHKAVIKGNYCHQGFGKQEIRKCQEFETTRLAQIKERTPEDFKTSYRPDVFVPIFQPEIGDSSEESWSESSPSVHSTQSELTEDSFNSCNNGGTNTSTHENLSLFESSVAEYLRNLSDEKRTEVMRKFSKIIIDH